MSSPRPKASLSKIGEFNLIRSISGTFPPRSSGVILGIGDDAAILRIPPGHHTVMSTDLLIEDVHFTTSTESFYDIGVKAAAANLSDMAAMGAKPAFLLVAIALPSTLTLTDWQALYRGLSRTCRDHGVHIVGGDTSASPRGCFISLTIVGIVRPGCALQRSGASPGDWIFVSGTLGDAAAGLHSLRTGHIRGSTKTKPSQGLRYLIARHSRPTPRIALGQLLSTRGWASAAIDISDGLSNDLGHLCRQSQAGALISASNIPLSSHLKHFAQQQGIDPLQWALHGGEDYELLFTVPPMYAKKVERAANRLHIPLTAIGHITSRRLGIRIQDPDQGIRSFPQAGYTHFQS
jgi:thiamine-monophosphate kinase